MPYGQKAVSGLISEVAWPQRGDRSKGEEGGIGSIFEHDPQLF
jgi:hypothetical protein